MNRGAFRWFLVARCASVVAYQMVAVAVGWQVYELTLRALDLGLVGLVQFIPSMILVLFVGHAADRYDRRKLVSLAQITEAAAILILCMATFGHWVNRDM